MAFIDLNKQTEHGGRTASALSQVFNGRAGLNAELAIFQTMLTGDGSNIAHFDVAVRKYGFGGWVANNEVTDPQRTDAKASWDELQSLAAKLNAGAGVGDSTGAAISQACAKHGV